ncbi:MAG TPA: methyltransferase domain-containing protein [Anaerolineales bacterium]|jgi:SAM-dependent methyltransferase|nr:methyltransferase domain-containing protein [Anaerolineales bacterium]
MSTKDAPRDVWASGDSYEPYVGRWSRLVAQEFIPWLAVPERSQWLDVGSGTGVLTQTILNAANPKKIIGIDRSEGFVDFARSKVNDPRAEFEVGNAQALLIQSEVFDAAVSGLVLNFVPHPTEMVAEMARAVGRGGVVALYVWDYAGKMQMMRHFWNAVIDLDPGARDLDEGRRFPICNPQPLVDLFQNAGLAQVQVRPIDVSADFKNFDDYWVPFLGGQGPAPGYVMSLTESRRSQLRQRIHNSLPFALDGTIPLVLRAWSVKGIKSQRI